MQAQFITIIGRVGGRNSSALGAFSDKFFIFNFDLPLPIAFFPTESKNLNITPKSQLNESKAVSGLLNETEIISLRRSITESDQGSCPQGSGDVLIRRLIICAGILAAVCIVRILVRSTVIHYKPRLKDCEKLKFPSWEGESNSKYYFVISMLLALLHAGEISALLASHLLA